ncbi:alpha/beta fold hydrolase BchO [Methyloversatilis thermotolerans]|uniref:alpha/beta fold hydrolase BchO n=1 Tax=Methyloversatilis thermotolerans TaxID=1346290 RepID=UPI0003638DED|nr:alpha/beta fold hydrolase BchO [Methyloversatilis thermotolerans]
MNARLDWLRDGTDWPHREHSRFVDAGGVRWHVQIAGDGPPLLLLHGAGASTHTWRDLLPRLTPRFRLIAPDLPGHAFSTALAGSRQGLVGIAHALGELLRVLGLTPAQAVGHSAGAALMLQMQFDGALRAAHLVGINGAVMPLPGLPGLLFPLAARLLAQTSLTARVFAYRARRPGAVERLVASTGSMLDARGLDLYTRLVRNPAHVEGVLRMMAHWDVAPLLQGLPRIDAQVTLIASAGDRTVPPDNSRRAARLLRHGEVRLLDSGGHLAHEEQPALFATLISAAADAPCPDVPAARTVR